MQPYIPYSWDMNRSCSAVWNSVIVVFVSTTSKKRVLRVPATATQPQFGKSCLYQVMALCKGKNTCASGASFVLWFSIAEWSFRPSCLAYSSACPSLSPEAAATFLQNWAQDYPGTGSEMQECRSFPPPPVKSAGVGERHTHTRAAKV